MRVAERERDGREEKEKRREGKLLELNWIGLEKIGKHLGRETGSELFFFTTEESGKN